MGSSHHLFPTTSLAQMVLRHCGSTGIGLDVAVRSEDWMSVIGAPMPNPLHFNDAAGFARAYQAYNLLRKFDSFPVEIDRTSVAYEGFMNSEVACGQVNREVDALPCVPGVPLELQPQSVVEFAKSLIHKALGKFDWDEFQKLCDFSNGASVRCKRKQGHAAFKLEDRPQVTKNCHDLAVHFIWCNEFWRKHCQELHGRDSDPWSWVEVVPGSRFDTVPKDSKTDRPICIEPDLNMFFQKGIGAMIRRRLFRRGINLNDQSINQWLALLGSLDNSLATIDLSSASDSVSLRVCEILLPEDWYRAMLMMRSPYVLMGDKYHFLQKISSMGNGFTFELESLIFWALAKASTVLSGEQAHFVSVYGDDIIVPRRSSQTLIHVLGLLGFKTNINKTFCDGPFRESCGKHYFLGVDVSPFKIESPIETWDDCYHFANSVNEWPWLDQEQKDEITSMALKAIPPRNRCYVPPSYGSRSGLRVHTPRGRMSYCHELGSLVWKFHYMREEVDTHEHNGPYAYLASMLLREQRCRGEHVVPVIAYRDKIGGRRFGTLYENRTGSYREYLGGDFASATIREEKPFMTRCAGSVSVWM